MGGGCRSAPAPSPHLFLLSVTSGQRFSGHQQEAGQDGQVPGAFWILRHPDPSLLPDVPCWGLTPTIPSQASGHPPVTLAVVIVNVRIFLD